MCEQDLQFRQKVVKYYLDHRTTLKETARRFKIHYNSVYKWHKLYRAKGMAGLLPSYKRPWNRTDKGLEEEIVRLKEREPSLTARKARALFRREGIRISAKGIWGIWKRYGYAGFLKDNSSSKHGLWTIEARLKYRKAKEAFEHGVIKESARILNSIPSLPENDLIFQLPDSLLNTRRKVEKITRLFWKKNLRSTLAERRSIYEKLKKENLYYSALRVGVMEVVALQWSGRPQEQLQRTEELKKIITPNKNGKYGCSSLMFSHRFAFLIAEGIAKSLLYRIKDAEKIARTCRKLLKRRKHPPPSSMYSLAVLYSFLDNYKAAEYWFLQSLSKADEERKKMLMGSLCTVYLRTGKYKEATNLIKHLQPHKWGSRSRILLHRASIFLVKGQPRKAISLCRESLSLSKKKDLNRAIYNAFSIIASSYCSIGEGAKGENILKRLIPFLVKKKLKKYENIVRTLLIQTTSTEIKKTLSRDTLPTEKLVLLLKNGQYRKALSLAEKKGIISYLHRFIFLYPEGVSKLLEEGKKTGLPRAMLRLPIFNKEVPVFNIKFLGGMVIYRNQRYLKSKLPPKDQAFVIQLALRAGAPGRRIPLQDLYDNFWPESQNPARNLSHLLVRVRKGLRIPSHLLEVSHRGGEPVLINRGIHFITDYGEFEQLLVTANAFTRAGEKEFARREFLQAFQLVRGMPLLKMYDRWSDELQRAVMNKLEHAAADFAKFCTEHGYQRDARKALKRFGKMLPNSEKLKAIVEA